MSGQTLAIVGKNALLSLPPSLSLSLSHKLAFSLARAHALASKHTHTHTHTQEWASLDQAAERLVSQYEKQTGSRCVCVCVCVCEREGAREKKKNLATEPQK